MTLLTGGTVTDVGDYRIHVFTSSGTLTVVEAGDVEYLVVAGGGGGGGSQSNRNSAGGGAGGLLAGTVNIPSTQTITVGAFGAGGVSGGSARGDDGTNSSIGALVVAIGGGGGGANTMDGSPGGSGGGAGCSAGVNSTGTGTAGQGFAGGNGDGSNDHLSKAGGGGGAGGVGANGVDEVADGDGGPGVSSSITGTAVTYAKGGAGGSKGVASVNPGDGGGGKRSGAGLNGKAGIVVVRYSLVDETPEPQEAEIARVTGTSVARSLARSAEGLTSRALARLTGTGTARDLTRSVDGLVSRTLERLTGAGTVRGLSGWRIAPPATTVSDDFNRNATVTMVALPDLQPPGWDWIAPPQFMANAWISQNILYFTRASGSQVDIETILEAGADLTSGAMEAQVTSQALSYSTAQAGVMVSVDGLARTGYALTITAAKVMRLVRWENGVETVLAEVADMSVSGGDVKLRREADGSLVGFHYGVQKIALTDPSPLPMRARAGVYGRSSSADSRALLDTFTATILSDTPEAQEAELARILGTGVARAHLAVPGVVARQIQRPAQSTGTARTLQRTPGLASRTLARLTGTGTARGLGAVLAASARTLDRITGDGLVRSYAASSTAVRVLARVLGVSVPRTLERAPGATQRALPRLAATGSARSLVRTPGAMVRILERLEGVSVLRPLVGKLLGFYRDLTITVSGPKRSDITASGPRGATMGVVGPKGSPYTITGPRR